MDKLTVKVAKLENSYKKFLIEEIYSPVFSFSQTQDRLLCAPTGGEPAHNGLEWGGEFAYGWFTGKFSVPKSQKGKQLYLQIKTGGVESLVFIDGKPIGMCDVVDLAEEPMFRCHQYIPIDKTDGFLAVESYAGHTYYGTAPHHGKKTFPLSAYQPLRVYEQISIVTFNIEIKQFMDNIELFNSYFRAFNENSYEKTLMYSLYEKMFISLEAMPDYPQKSLVASANSAMEKFFASLKKGQGFFVGAIGHSHLDTVWLWDMPETRRKLLRTVATAVENLKRYPQYKFFMSTVLYLEWIKEDFPNLFLQIKDFVKQGRFEPNGSTYVECDCVLTSGESLVRQFLYGKRFLKNELDYDSDTFWLPDTFGYSPALPQIMQLCGVKNFLTTKLSWNDTNVFPYESFMWQGINGSKVKAHFNTIHCPLNPETVNSRISKLANKHYCSNALISYGFGDGGGGPSSDMVNQAIRTENSCPFADVEHISVSDFMDRLSQDNLPIYRGELYLELHRGTLTMHQPLKQLNRQLEIALHDLEVLCVLSNDESLKQEIERLYKVMLINQFHDILPGTSIQKVNECAINQLTSALAQVKSLIKSIGGSNGKNKDNLFNTLSFAREDTVCLPCADGDFTTLTGEKSKFMRIKAEAYSSFNKVDGKNLSPFKVIANSITTPFGSVTILNGVIKSYKVFGREISDGCLNRLTAGEDVPNLWDNWDIDADYSLKQQPIKFVSASVILNNANVLVYRSKFNAGKNSVVEQDIVLDAFSPRITFNTMVDWQDEHIVLNTNFNTNLVATTVKSEVQFGFIERQAFANTTYEQAQFIKSNYKWSDISETYFGLTLINDCKYGFFCNGGTFGLNLFKCGVRPDPMGDKGKRCFSYALLPHSGGFSAKNVVQPAYAFNYAPVYATAENRLLQIEEPNIICETLKHGEDGDIIARLYESDCAATNATIHFNSAYEITQTDILENNISATEIASKIELQFKPFEIKTLRIKLANKTA